MDGTVQAPFAGVASRAARLPAELRATLLTPALLIDLDAVRRNVARVLALLGGAPERWRPHLKTTKCPAVWAVLVEQGVRHFKVATTRELEVLLTWLEDRGVAGDVLVAQGLGPPAARRCAQLARAHPRQQVSVMVEDLEQLPWVEEPLGLFVDLDPGMGRTGRALAERARTLELLRAAGLRLRGLHCYEGHLHGPFPGRAAALEACFGELLALLADCAAGDIAVGEVVSSGTPALHHVARRAPLARAPGAPRHRLSAGTVVLHDLRSEQENPELGLEPAALVLARVVSAPRAGRCTVDAGSKALAAEAGEPIAAVLGRPELVAATCSEEHLPLDAPPGAPAPGLGELLELVPRHVCPTVNLHERALLLEERGLRWVEIAARAHDWGCAP
jgi:D-serine deaminase-like pyridoxal phosphate-dependent protein